MNQQHLTIISNTSGIPVRKISATAQLLADGASVPFIARYRKEATGSLDELAIADIQTQIRKLGELEKRRASILQSIEEQGVLSEALRRQIEQTFDPTELEDLYLPYKRKRQTRAGKARAQGLEPLATAIFKNPNTQAERSARAFLTEEVPDVESALSGARDIIAEWINEDMAVRDRIRRLFKNEATIRSKLVKSKESEAGKYRDYFDYEEQLQKCPSHRLLAIRRGEDEGLLRVAVGPDKEKAIYQVGRMVIGHRGPATAQVEMAIEDSYKRLLHPAIETEFRNSSKAKADEEAIRVFAENLRQLLLAAPLGQQRVLAIDPGFRTGCKVVCLDENGSLLHHTTIYPHPPQQQADQSVRTISDLMKRYHLDAIAIGNGTAGRETMQLLTDQQFENLFMVNESGASIYSASEIARTEFPDLDLTVRGSVSIGRRLMDPLAELVKLDPKSIGVGQYQHDVNQSLLKDELDQVVESCVNQVGINLNTASQHLLTYVSGLGPVLAQNIVDHRTAHGSFSSRSQLKKVSRLGDKAFEQCAGFLRIRTARNPLDNTAVHPESYGIVKQMADDLSCTVRDLVERPELRKQIRLDRYVNDQVGLPTLKDILSELAKPGLDPRGAAQSFAFDQRVRSMEDVKEGMILPGIVTNITNFGAFVDIGVKQDGLVHISQLANRFVKDPLDVVQLQQKVEVKVMEVDRVRGRIQLSMKEV